MKQRRPVSDMVTSSSQKPQLPNPIRPNAPRVGFFKAKNSDRSILKDAASIDDPIQDDTYNYILLIALYTLQGIPMGLSASIPFLIQQKMKQITETLATAAATSETMDMAAASVGGSAAVSASATAASVTKMAYNAQAIFALCSWPFSLKLLWAPIVDSVFIKRVGRRKSWLVPVQYLAGMLMVTGSDYVERQLGSSGQTSLDVKGVTAFFFCLYFLMATQDIAVDGWALTMLNKKNRGRGPVCNSIGQNLGYFLAFVGFLAFNDAESSDKLWRPLLGLKPNGTGLISLGSFIRFMGFVMLGITTFVAVFKTETNSHGGAYTPLPGDVSGSIRKQKNDDDDDAEIDSSVIGLRETYQRLWTVCKLPAVRWLFLILLTNRFPTALSDKVKLLKAVEFGLSKQTTALLAPTIILPLGILVPIIATKVWKGHPLKQFITAYKLRVTLVPVLDIMMLLVVRSLNDSIDLSSRAIFWLTIIVSTAVFSIVESMQFNAQMVFFAHRVDPAIGGTYMTLLNTAANLGSTWPASAVMYLVGQFSSSPQCETTASGVECKGGREAYFPMQIIFSILGCLWVYLMGSKVKYLSELPDDAWRTHEGEESEISVLDVDIEKNTSKRGSKKD